MMTLNLVTHLLGAALSATVALTVPAGEDDRRSELRAKVMQRFDRDQDGKLDAPERAAAREAVRNRLEGRDGRIRKLMMLRKRFGQRGLGQRSGPDPRGLSPRAFGQRGAGEAGRSLRGRVRERASRLRATLLERFDADGDGELGPTEREQVRDALRNRRSSRGRGPI